MVVNSPSFVDTASPISPPQSVRHESQLEQMGIAFCIVSDYHQQHVLEDGIIRR